MENVPAVTLPAKVVEVPSAKVISPPTLILPLLRSVPFISNESKFNVPSAKFVITAPPSSMTKPALIVASALFFTSEPSAMLTSAKLASPPFSFVKFSKWLTFSLAKVETLLVPIWVLTVLAFNTPLLTTSPAVALLAMVSWPFSWTLICPWPVMLVIWKRPFSTDSTEVS